MVRNRIDAGNQFSIGFKLALTVLLASAPLCGFTQAGMMAKPDDKAAATVAPADEATINSFAFDVVAVKPFKQDGQGVTMMTRYTPTGITAQGTTLQMLIRMAYGLEDNQIVNLPSGFGTDSWEVDAKMDDETTAAFNKLGMKDQMKARQHMLQGMLADRFKLAAHKETRDLPVFNLVVAKGGPKFQEAKEGDAYPNGIKGPDGKSRGGMMMMGPGTITMQGAEIKGLVTILSDQTRHHIVDKTGLTGKYDVTLKWTPEDRQGAEMKGAASGGGADAPPPESSGPSIFVAIQEQLGLKLESAKAPVEVLVIDHADRPSAN